MADNAHPWADVRDGRTSLWTAASSKTRQNGTLQPNLGGVKMALMNPRDSLAARSRLDITPKWVDIQICIITCYASLASYCEEQVPSNLSE